MSFASEKQIDEVLSAAQLIAIVGLSNKPERDSYKVAQYLREQGYQVIGVNPLLADSEIDGMPCYASLEQAQHAQTQAIDIVDCFRKSEEVLEIANSIRNMPVKCFWMQLGVINHAAAEIARAAGQIVVMDKCTKIEHRRMRDRQSV
ncbi:MAG: CoA-binding protein [Burkholderiaceae bacterium]|nr:MAG: CoA-binding protein [Burkholderiaceae bacterium]